MRPTAQTDPRGASGTARASRRFGGLVLCAVLGGLVPACVAPPRERVEALPDAPYPICDGDAQGTGRELGSGELRAGPMMRESSVVERFTLAERDCHVVYTGAQDWDLGATDLEVVYDRELRPLRAWKRSTSPGPLSAGERTDVRSYDFRGERLAMRRRGATGELELWRFRLPPPAVVIGPGRGLLTVWLQRARLDVGGRVREPAVDIREAIEVIRDVTLTRHEDRDDPEMGRVRVYTIYGREPIFADEHDVVVGDMMGMRPARLITTPLSTPVARAGPPDPRGTP